MLAQQHNKMKSLTSFVCASCRRARTTQPTSVFQPKRNITSSAPKPADDAFDGITSRLSRITQPSRNNNNATSANRPSPYNFTDMLSGPPSGTSGSLLSTMHAEPPHRLHVYATKHNTHLTFTAPSIPKENRSNLQQQDTTHAAPEPNKMLITLSAGNIGFRKAGRGSYDAGYQLAAFMLKQVQERGLLRDINKLEIVLRGFGAGREAVTKAILGQEGKLIRNRITAVTDATRLKFGGPRSPKPRRLG